VLSKNLVPMARSVYPPARLAVVPNGCPSAVPPTRSGVRDEAHPLVAYIGRLSREKGLEDALAAAATVANAVPTVQFVFCGEWDSPSYETHIRSTVEQSGLAAAARFPGPVTADDKTELLSRAWALWVPSHSEGQPWVILEAMSAGLPVVATDTGAIPETVADGESGFVVPVGDSDGLAARIVALLEDHDLWKKLARRSLERYQAEFTVSRSHAALADVLARVIRDDSGAAT
jgi:glycosyltransferase involved in cell wall biosynthesis